MEPGAAPDDDPSGRRARRGRPPRDVVLLLVGAAVLYIAFWLAVRLRSLLVMLLISLFLAFALEPAATCWPAGAGAGDWPPRPCSRP